jgi:acyl-CoA thioester hydrolase
MTEPFRVRIQVRLSDLDTNRHVRGPVYLDYADQARWECVKAAGVSMDALAARGLGLVNLETTIRFLRELRTGDEVETSSAFVYGSGKTFRVEQRLSLSDGTSVAEVRSVSGVLDLETRRLVPNHVEELRSLASRPEVLGL